MKKDLISQIIECQGYLNEHVIGDGMDILDLKFQITLERLKYELSSKGYPSRTTISAMHQLCVFTTGYYRRILPKFEEKTGMIFYALNEFSEDLKNYKTIPLGTEPEDWQKFYKILGDEEW